ncbi:MAG: GntR family transcriptional regulator [Candidatus Omnitrophica bacterium]|nr:GntR family transcriptional regulator [Candidatus Omnitrophota bacterium]
MRFHESLLNLIKSEAKFKIVEFLLKHEASMSEREIASILGISHMSVNRAMRELADMNLVHYAVIGKAHLWQVNHKSLAFKTLEQLMKNLNAVSDPLSELKRVIIKHLPKSHIINAVLFGSIAKAKEKPDSDIDLFILVKNIKSQKVLEESIERLSAECLDIFGNRLAPYILTEREHNEKKNLEVISEIEQGIQLYPIGKIKR